MNDQTDLQFRIINSSDVWRKETERKAGHGKKNVAGGGGCESCEEKFLNERTSRKTQTHTFEWRFGGERRKTRVDAS